MPRRSSPPPWSPRSSAPWRKLGAAVPALERLFGRRLADHAALLVDGVRAGAGEYVTVELEEIAVLEGEEENYYEQLRVALGSLDEPTDAVADRDRLVWLAQLRAERRFRRPGCCSTTSTPPTMTTGTSAGCSAPATCGRCRGRPRTDRPDRPDGQRPVMTRRRAREGEACGTGDPARSGYSAAAPAAVPVAAPRVALPVDRSPGLFS
ncbi:hypothetical protein V6U90_22720 [Micromonospora sp. CPCC 206060]|uniref:hypothetical protein n=1 Tax=Micromonospora sp. CPCC 206060 TaxID=3122406 RepID=UPI002FF2ACBD